MTIRLIIILGYTLSHDCSIHPILKSRLDAALSISQQTDKFLVCGKSPSKLLVPSRCETLTEAEAMKRYLIIKGISEENIIKEEQSTTTFGNAFYGLSLVDVQLPNSILIISNEFHYPLIKYSFEKVFGDKYPYSFHIIPDSSLNVEPQEIEQWKVIINKMISECYPLLFSEVKNGDINKLKSIVEGPINSAFEARIKDLLHLEDSADIREFICG